MGPTLSKAQLDEMSVEAKQELLEDACAILVHEIGHMFAIHHCTFYECVMNGVMSK